MLDWTTIEILTSDVVSWNEVESGRAALFFNHISVALITPPPLDWPFAICCTKSGTVRG